MPRPKKHKSELNKVVSLRLTKDEHAIYLNKVNSSGLNASEFFRTCILKNKTQIIAKPVQTEEQKHMVYLFNKTGNAIQQLAHSANTAYLTGKASESTFKEILTNLESISHSFKQALKYAD